MSKHNQTEPVHPYRRAAGGWDALRYSIINLYREKVNLASLPALLKQNQPSGFDCPGCAWPERRSTSRLEFCENGVKAIAAELTSKRVTRQFFAQHTVQALLQQTDFELEMHGRLTEPMIYHAPSDTYQPISWDQAYGKIAEHLNALGDPDQASFYASGRTSNEAAFLYQLFVRLYGSNNFPDCSNMCHEATSRGLPPVVGVGKGTVTLDDFEHADALFIFGQNPGSNHPRMLGELRDCARRGTRIVSINPLRERGLERFTSPQHALEMLSGSSTPICSLFIRPRLGGDLALIKAVAKRVIELDDEAQAQQAPRLIDVDFIHEHTDGFVHFADNLRQTPWALLIEESGVSRPEIETLSQIYLQSKAVIATWGMGITQHRQSVATIQMLANLMMLRGNIGRQGTGLCPVRGHSNVQGNRSVGIDERPSDTLLDRLAEVYQFEPPRQHGLDVVDTIQAMLADQVKVFIALGGNFVQAAPDSPRTCQAMQACQLTVHIATKLNRSHLIHGREALLLPTIGRSEQDVQATGLQSVSVEDSMSMVHLSRGFRLPAAPTLRSEVAIIAQMAQATLGGKLVDWLALAADYDKIRDEIARVFPDFADYNQRVRHPGGFHLGVPARDRVWHTATGRARFVINDIEQDTPIRQVLKRYGTQVLCLMSTRSHDQYNTTIYGMDDRYRGIWGQRDIILINREDLTRLGLNAGERVDVESIWHDGSRWVHGFKLVVYDIPQGCIAAYYPEVNPLIPLDSVGLTSNTPTSKSIPVLLHKSASGNRSTELQAN